MASVGPLLIPALALGAAAGSWGGLGLGAVVLALYASEILIGILHASGSLPAWLDVERLPLTHVRKLRSSRRGTTIRHLLMAVHYCLLVVATVALLDAAGGVALLSWRFGELAFALIVLFAQAEVLGHELSHIRHARAATTALYALVGGADGMINHTAHHHAWYGTERDVLSRHFNERYFGLGQRIAFQLRQAWQIDRQRLLTAYSLHLTIVVGIGAVLGTAATVIYLASVVAARLMAEALSVFSHYDLNRASAHQAPLASWDVAGLSLFDYLGGYGITRHPSHHANPSVVPVPMAGAPLLPGFLWAATLCWLCPPLFRWSMDEARRNSHDLALLSKPPGVAGDDRAASERLGAPWLDRGENFLLKIDE